MDSELPATILPVMYVNFTMTAIPAGTWATLGIGFYLTISRNTAGILNVRFEDLN